MISYCLSGSALANVPAKDFGFLFTFFLPLFLFLCFSPYCGPGAGREEGSLAQGEEWVCFYLVFFSLV